MENDESTSAEARLLNEALDALEAALDRLPRRATGEIELAALAPGASSELADALARLHAAAKRASP